MQAVSQPGRPEDSPPWETSVSTWIDGEADIRPEDLDTPYGRQVWDTYHLIGDVLRNPDLAIRPSDLFYARISKAIDAEPPIVAPRALRRHGVVRVGLSGLAVAAAVVSVAWVALPYFTGPQSGAPAHTQVIASAADDAAFHDYLDAHRDMAGIGPVRQVSFDAGAQR